MLDGHSRLAVPPESHFVAAFAGSQRMTARFRFRRYLRALGRDARFRIWDLPLAAVAAEGAGAASLADAVRATYRAYARQRGKDRWGDKTPGYALQVPALAALLPEAVFLHVIRDGRDVALSLLEASFGPMDVAGAAAYWKERVEAARRAGVALGPERYLEVRYEDLVAGPEAPLRAMCELARLDYEPGMADHRPRAAAVAASTTDPSLHETLVRPLHLARNWRDDLVAPLAAEFERVAGDTLAAFGYPPAARD